MSTTTVRLPDSLKARIAALAERAGKTAHGLILEAIAEKVEREEQREDFEQTADERYANLIASGKTIPWSEMRAELEHRVAGKPARTRGKKVPA